MSNPFFDAPILNSPYEYPDRHWELDSGGLPTQQIIDRRRGADFETAAIPKPKASKLEEQAVLGLEDDEIHAAIINGVRREVDKWRRLPESQWRVTPETAALLKHWRHHRFAGV